MIYLLGVVKKGRMESCLWNWTESISSTVFLPYESDLLKDAEIFHTLESDLWNVAEPFSLLECYLLKVAEIHTLQLRAQHCGHRDIFRARTQVKHQTQSFLLAPPTTGFSVRVFAVPWSTKIGQNDFNLVTRPPIKILRPLFTLQLLILLIRDPFQAQIS